ncbi:hypothetical protein, partial [Pelomonas sp. KK5]|uniref:hypothetical protein n=1 Tax=Pelomonas sp. KK5 TaxID=1855730 RepID=UPI0018E9E973
MKIKIAVFAAMGLLTGAAARADAVNAVSYASFTGTVLGFEELASPNPDGTLIDGLLSSGGVQFGERFAGQELAVTKAPRPGAVAQDWFDDLSYGSPSAGLTLLAGAAGQNLGVY